MISNNSINRIVLILSLLSWGFASEAQKLSIQECIDSWDLVYYQDSLSGLDSLIADSNSYLEGNAGDSLRSLLSSYMAYAYEEHLRYDSALIYYEVAADLYDSQNDLESTAHMYYGSAGCYAELLEYALSTETYLKALTLYDSLGLEEDAADTENALAGNFYLSGDYDVALKYFKSAISYYDKTNIDDQVAMIYTNIATVYQSLEVKDSVYHYYQMALSKVIDTEHYGQLIDVYHGIGFAKEEQGLMDDAYYYYRRGLEVSLKHPDQPEYLAYSYQYMGYYFLAVENYDSALLYALKVSEITRSYTLSFLKHNNLELLYNIYRQTGDYEKALSSFESYTAITDSVYTVKLARQLNLLERQYSREKEQIESLGDDLEAVQSQADQNRYEFLKSLLIVSLIFLLIFIVLLIRNYGLGYRLKQVLVRKESELREKQKRINELGESKSKWFVNLAHELRTPLSLIKGPLQQITRVTGMDKENTDLISMALRSVSSLEQLINDLLDISKMESGEVTLKLETFDFILYIKSRLQQWSKIDKGEGNVTFESGGQSHLLVRLDQQRIGRALQKLVDNAMLYSPAGGKVTISLMVSDQHLSIKVTDRGMGITQKDLPFVFDRFYRSNSAQNQNPGGKGLGLSLVKEVVEMHNGEIDINTALGSGTSITLKFPSEVVVDKSVASPNDSLNEQIVGLAPLILVVEDNPDMQTYINQFLDKRYDVMHAMNPHEALEMMKERKPNLIISDIMMPKMDGSVFIQKLKEDLSTHQIPIVVISAIADEEKRLQLLRMGVSHYFAKPFSPEELSITIDNLIKQYEDQNKAKDLDGDIQELSHTDRLIKNLEDIVKSHMDDAEFSVQTLAEAASLSERQLYRYLRQTVSMTPANFIKELRLQRAFDLAKKNVYATTAELSYAVGFQHPSYFTSVFKKRFGKKPSDFMKEQST